MSMAFFVTIIAIHVGLIAVCVAGIVASLKELRYESQRFASVSAFVGAFVNNTEGSSK